MNLFDQLSIFKHINGIIYKHSELSKNTEKKEAKPTKFKGVKRKKDKYYILKTSQ